MEIKTLHDEAMSLAEALEDEAAYFPANSRLMYKSAMMLRLLALKVSEDDTPTNDNPNSKFYGNRLWVRIGGIWHMLMRSKQSWNAEMVWKKSCDSRKVSGLHDGNTSYSIPKDAGTCLCIICIQKSKRVHGR